MLCVPQKPSNDKYSGEGNMRATEFLSAQEALWLVKVIFDQTYSVINTSLQQREQSAVAQQPAKAKSSPTRTRVVVVPGKAAPNPTKKQAATQTADKTAKPATSVQPQKAQPKSYAAVKPRRPVGPQ